MRPEWKAILLICLLLVGQAACELALPGFTSSLVNIGVQQDGIPDVLAQRISAVSYRRLGRLMDEKDQAAVRAAYRESEGDFVLRGDLDAAQRAAAREALELPMAALFSLSQYPQGEAMLQMLDSGQMTLEMIRQQMKDRQLSASMLPEQMAAQAAAQFVRAEYGRLGIDIGGVRNAFLWDQGLRMLGITLLMGLFAVGSSFLGSRAGARVGRRLRSQVFARVLSFSKAEVDRFSTASLITRSTNDINQVQHAGIMMLRMLLYAPIMASGGILRVIRARTGMGWIIALTVGVMLTLVLSISRVVIPKFKTLQKLTDRMNLVARENLTGIQVVRAFSRQEHEIARYDKANADLTGVMLFINRTFAYMMPLMMIIINGVSLMIIWFGAQGVDAGRIQVGDMIAFITYTMQIAMSFMMIAMVSAVMMPRAEVAAQRIGEVLDTEPSVSSPGQPQALPETGRGRLVFDRVSFRYPDSREDVLHELNFEALPGQTTAVIGATGSGKSTLLNLIPRFFDVTSGRITLDGVDIRQLALPDLRGRIGLVPQQAQLFSGTIEHNLRFAGDGLSLEQLEEAAGIAQASDFIAQKEDGYQSEVAQDASNFSGGQKQRLSIARAIAARPEILLFDDSFSALDYRTDLKVRQALRERLGGATVLIVAQRIATVMQADKILVIKEGRLVAQGTHSELMECSPEYQQIARSQLSDEELSGEGGKRHV